MYQIYHIYQIKNLNNGMSYYGMSQEVETRWAYHKRLLKGNYHNNKELQNDYNKGHRFEYRILKQATSKEKADSLEKSFIEGDREHVYNFTFSGKKREPATEEVKAKISESRKGKSVGEENHFYGKKHTKESLEKMKKSLSKIDRTGENNPFSRKVECYGIVYGSVKEAMKASGFKKYTFYKKLKDENNDDIRYLD